jgi:NitT/TauT family transport system substrate-binding protein
LAFIVKKGKGMLSKRLFHSRRPLIALVSSLALGGFAFGYGPSEKSVSGPVIKLAHFPNVTHAPAIVGVARGTFAEEVGKGVTISTKVFTAGPEEMEALLAGEIDVAYVGPGPAINTFVKSAGKALKIVGGACQDGASLIARTGSGIRSLRDLDGKRIAVPQLGGTQDVSCRAFIAGEGLTPKERGGTVEIIPIKPADVAGLFQRGELDAAWVPEPWASRLACEGTGDRIIDEKDLWKAGTFPTTLIVARTKFLEQHADQVAQLLAGHVATVRWMEQNQKESMDTVNNELKRLTGKALPKEVIQQAWDHVKFASDVDMDGLAAMVQAMSAAGYLKGNQPGVEQMIDRRVLTIAGANKLGK